MLWSLRCQPRRRRRAAGTHAEAQERPLLSRGVRQSRYKTISPTTADPSPIQAQRRFAGLQLTTRTDGLHLCFSSFHFRPAFSQSALVIGYSAAMAGVTIAPARLRAIIVAKSFIALGSLPYAKKERRPRNNKTTAIVESLRSPRTTSHGRLSPVGTFSLGIRCFERVRC